MNAPPEFKINRRAWIGGTASLLAMAGCTPDEVAPAEQTAASVSDVPLRIVWPGTEAEAETLRRTWQSISEQTLDIRLVQMDVASGNAIADLAGAVDLIEMAGKADVVVYPLTLMAEMIGEKRLMPLLADRAKPDESDVFVAADRRSLPPALKVAASFANEQRAVPLGGHVPAMMMGESIGSQQNPPSVETWVDYHRLAKSSDGKCAEPTSAGWAGAMFMWRLCTSLDTKWLFDRRTMQPLIAEPDYVAVLEQMSQTVKLNKNANGFTPGGVFEAVAAGELVAGIGFPYSKSQLGDVSGQVTFTALPSSAIAMDDEVASLIVDGDLRRSMMNPFMLVGSLAATCRQTAAADQFLKWLAGGQGSEPLYRNIDSVIDLRTKSESSGAAAGYSDWLRARMSNPNVVPTLQLAGAMDYYQVLDESVRECVHGSESAADTCQKISDAWMDLHRKFGVPAQQRAWRRAQGIA